MYCIFPARSISRVRPSGAAPLDEFATNYSGFGSPGRSVRSAYSSQSSETFRKGGYLREFWVKVWILIICVHCLQGVRAWSRRKCIFVWVLTPSRTERFEGYYPLKTGAFPKSCFLKTQFTPEFVYLTKNICLKIVQSTDLAESVRMVIFSSNLDKF